MAKVKKGYHRTKSGKIAKKGLWYNVNKRKKKGISRSKAKSTISAKAYRTSQNRFSLFRLDVSHLTCRDSGG